MLKTENNDIILNGVNVTDWTNTKEAVSEDSTLAKFIFKADNRWLGGSVNKTAINGFYGAGEEQGRAEPFFYNNDEPPVLLGADTSANPAEFLLHALVGCLTTTLAYHAAARGIEVEKIDSEIEGDMDARPFLDLPNDVKPGFINIAVKMRVKTKAKPDELKKLAMFSPIYQTVKNGPKVDLKIETY